MELDRGIRRAPQRPLFSKRRYPITCQLCLATGKAARLLHFYSNSGRLRKAAGDRRAPPVKRRPCAAPGSLFTATGPGRMLRFYKFVNRSATVQEKLPFCQVPTPQRRKNAGSLRTAAAAPLCTRTIGTPPISMGFRLYQRLAAGSAPGPESGGWHMPCYWESIQSA